MKNENIKKWDLVKDGKVDMIHSSGSKGVNISKDIFNNNYESLFLQRKKKIE